MSKQHTRQDSKDASTETENTNNKSSSKETFNKFLKIAFPILLILICMFFASYYRASALDLDITDSWARSTVYNNVQYQIAQQVDSQNPFLPDSQKAALVQVKLTQYMKDNNVEAEKAIAQLSQNFKEKFRDDNGDNYLVGIDPYFFYRFIRNIVNTGQPGEYMRDGKSYSTFMLAPTEMDVSSDAKIFHVYFTVYLFKFLHMFNQNIHLIALFAIIPVIFAALCMIPAFLIGRKMAGNLAGFIAATYIGLHVSILARTTAGFSDTDIYNIFFPLLVIFLIVYAIESEKLWKSITYSLLAAFTLLIYYTAWPAGWWYMFYFPLAAFGVAFLIKLIQPIIHHKKNKLKLEMKHLWNETSKIVITGATFVIATITVIAVYTGSFIGTIKDLFSFLNFSSIKNAAEANLWPNVYTTVAEMNSGSMGDIISSIGNISTNFAQSYIFGIIILIFAVIGIYLLIIKDTKNVSNIGVAAMFAFWTLASIWASLKGIRFVMFIIAPLGLCLGIFFDLLIERISNSMHDFMQISKTVTKISLSLIVAVLLVFSMTSLAKVTAKNEIPSMDDAWQNTLTKIKNESQPTAIISSWWDFGHEFITVAERGATADGGVQNTPQARWLGRIFIANDARESAGMLRMLNCDANGAYNKLFNFTNDTIKSIEILDNTDVMGKSDARKYLLANGLTSSQADDVLLSTHCTPPESFVITSEDMGCVRQQNGCSGKTGVWAHFGLWNFSKAKIWLIVSDNDRATALKLMVENKLVADQKEAVNTYNLLSSFDQNQANSWISSWPNYAMPMMACNEAKPNYYECQNGAIINMTNKTAMLSTNKGLVNANSLTYLENGSIKTVEIDAKEQFSVAFSGTEAIIASPDVAQSVFTQLFYLNNGGEYFTQFDDVTTVLGDRILTWKVNWDKVLAED